MNIKIQQLKLNKFYNDFHKHFAISAEIENQWVTLNNRDAVLTAKYFPMDATILLIRDSPVNSNAHKFILELIQQCAVNGPFQKLETMDGTVAVHSNLYKYRIKIEPLNGQSYDILYWVSASSYENVVGLQEYLQEFMPDAECACIYTVLKPEKDC